MVKVKVVKLSDVLAQLGISRWTLYEWLKMGKLQGFKLPFGHYRVTSDALDKFRQRVTPVNGSSGEGSG